MVVRLWGVQRGDQEHGQAVSALRKGYKMGSVNDNPCRYCTPPKRQEGCHGTCKEYIDYRVNVDAKAKKKRQENAADAVLAENSRKRKIRYHRRKGGQ